MEKLSKKELEIEIDRLMSSLNMVRKSLRPEIVKKIKALQEELNEVINESEH